MHGSMQSKHNAQQETMAWLSRRRIQKSQPASDAQVSSASIRLESTVPFLLPACLSPSVLLHARRHPKRSRRFSLAINKISFFLFVVPFPFRNRASLLKLQVHIKGGRVWPPYIKQRSSSAERWCKGVLSLRGFIRRKRGVSHDGCPVAVVDIESISQSVSRPVLTF